MTGCVSKMPNFHAFTQTEKAKSNHLTSRKRPTLYILFDLAPPPLQARLNKVYLLICDCSRSWVCGHFHGRTGRCRWLLCHLRLVRRIFRGRKGPFSFLRRAVFTCAEERLRKKNAQILISKLCICAQMLHHVQLFGTSWTVALEEGHGNPSQYSCLEHPMDRGAWQATVYMVAKNWSDMTEAT